MIVSERFTAKDNPRSIRPSRRALSSSPRLVSVTIAVVSTRVLLSRLPPTTIDAPTSETIAPKDAIIVARSPSLASLARSHIVRRRPAPRTFSRSPSLGWSAWIDAVVKPTTIGVAMRNCARAMPVFVYMRLNSPSGPLRTSRIQTRRPTTTGGIPMPVLMNPSRMVRPRKFLRAMVYPIGTPRSTASAVATLETANVRRTMGRMLLSVTGECVRKKQRLAILIPAEVRDHTLCRGGHQEFDKRVSLGSPGLGMLPGVDGIDVVDVAKTLRPLKQDHETEPATLGEVRAAVGERVSALLVRDVECCAHTLTCFFALRQRLWIDSGSGPQRQFLRMRSRVIAA